MDVGKCMKSQAGAIAMREVGGLVEPTAWSGKLTKLLMVTGWQIWVSVKGCGRWMCCWRAVTAAARE
eukprot:scaffold88652_cov35-Tisochrysis_lutea.AAC.2